MKTLVDQLSQYAAYHRDSRNLVTHVIGIPMIVVAVVTLLSRPALDLGSVPLSPATIVAAIAIVYYLLLDLRIGLAMLVAIGLAVAGGQWFASLATAAWLAWGLGLFVVGWIFQFVGHYYEGRKPAFVDDIVGLLIGPLFVVAEIAFAMGLRTDVKNAIEARVGPMHEHLRDGESAHS